MPCSVVVGYQRFRGACCLHLQGGETRYPTTTLNGVTIQKILTLFFRWIFTAVKFASAVITSRRPVAVKVLKLGVRQPEKFLTLWDLGFDGKIILKMHLKEIWCEVVDWIHLANDRVQCRVLVTVAINLQIPQKAGNLLASWTTVSYLKRNLFDGLN